MPTPAHVSMPGAPGAHPAYEPTLEDREALDRQYGPAVTRFARRLHAAAVLMRRGSVLTESPSQDWPRHVPALVRRTLHDQRCQDGERGSL